MPKQKQSKSDGTDDNGVSNKIRSTPLSYWFLTWNNYTEDDWAKLGTVVLKECRKVSYQEEVGKQEGTPHIQGSFVWKKRIRKETLIKKFPGSWWKPSGGRASLDYCKKEDTVPTCGRRIEWGDYDPEEFVKKPKTLWKPPYKVFDDIEAICLGEPDRRTIHWFWESEGNFGKTAFAKYMYRKHNAKVICSEKSADILTSIRENDKIIIFDWPRCADVSHTCPFNALEQIKNGFVSDGKLKKWLRTIDMEDPPHVICFANNPPAKHKLSIDRWHIVEMTKELTQTPEGSDSLCAESVNDNNPAVLSSSEENIAV